MKIKAHNGFVLPMAVIITLAASILVTGVISYTSHQARMTRHFLGKSRCRFAAQSVLEQAKYDIQNGFLTYTGRNAASIKVDPKQAEAFNWFDNISADGKTIGIADAKSAPVTLEQHPEKVCGCDTYVGINASGLYHPTGSALAIVPILATAVYTSPDGQKVTVTLQERVAFGTGQSQVFDYAYFVNNYGWMNGSSITINGDMRANGNVSVIDSTINGYIYAAKNQEVGANGVVSMENAKIKSQSDYRNSSANSNRTRWDRGNYDIAGAYDAPRNSGSISAPTFDRNGNVKSGTVGGVSGLPIVNNDSESIPMPFVSELDSYIDYAKDKKGTLECPSYSYVGSDGKTYSINQKKVNAHYNGAGPSGNPELADNGALVLIGTIDNPIKINGPVVVDSDVVIKGYVQGQGTIYSGRNVHIIGSLIYKNQPVWNASDNATKAAEREITNASCDMLGLVAKGNIVIGNSEQTNSDWHNSVDPYIRPKSISRSSVVNAYACDDSDAAIGYPKQFDGNYTSEELVRNLNSSLAAIAPGGWDSSSGKFGKLRYNERYETTTTKVPVMTTERVKENGKYVYKEVQKTDKKGNLVFDTKTETTKIAGMETSYNRRYYETVCDDNVLYRLQDSGGVGQIDAIIYNNHGIFGTPGVRNKVFNLNGAMVCRDEAMLFRSSTINFNWDMRLKRRSDNKVTNMLSLPVGPQNPYTVDWREVADNQNPVYAAAISGEDS